MDEADRLCFPPADCLALQAGCVQPEGRLVGQGTEVV